MIRFTFTGTILKIQADIPKRLTGGERCVYFFDKDLGGSAPAVAALVQAMEAQMSERIAQIRKEAYLQGARDRAKRATDFSGSWDLGHCRGGCH